MSAATMDLPESYLTADRGPALRAFVIVMVVITILSILLRLMSRSLSPSQPGHNQSHFWLDDWTALIAVVRLSPLPHSFQHIAPTVKVLHRQKGPSRNLTSLSSHLSWLSIALHLSHSTEASVAMLLFWVFRLSFGLPALLG